VASLASRLHSSCEHFVLFPLDSRGHVCRMRGRKVRNEQDARPKLAQKFAHASAGDIEGAAAELRAQGPQLGSQPCATK
jgi:hypothetical protein